MSAVLYAKVGTQIIFFSPQIANPQILGLIPQLKIRKFLKCESPQIANPQIATVAKQNCGFAICGTYLRTAHLWMYVLYCNVHCTLKRKYLVVQY